VLYDRLSHPVLTNVAMSFGGLQTHSVYPKKLPALFKGSEVMIFGRYQGGGEHTIKVAGQLHGKPVEYSCTIDAPKKPAGQTTAFVAPLWASRNVGFLLQELRLHGPNDELIKEVVPGARRVAVVSTPDPQHAESLKLLLGAAPRFGLELRNVLVSGGGDLDRIFTEIGRGRADAVLVQPSPDIDEMRSRIAQLAEKQRLPSMFALRQYAEAGGLMSYGADLYDMQRHVASYVDKILKGAKPTDLPVEQPTKFELVINLKTAKALGLTIPQTLLLRADQLIE